MATEILTQVAFVRMHDGALALFADGKRLHGVKSAFVADDGTNSVATVNFNLADVQLGTQQLPPEAVN